MEHSTLPEWLAEFRAKDDPILKRRLAAVEKSCQLARRGMLTSDEFAAHVRSGL